MRSKLRTAESADHCFSDRGSPPEVCDLHNVTHELLHVEELCHGDYFSCVGN